jgi:hypothetical protein
MDDAERTRRAQRREFIRNHHPDRGGDPAEFLAGLRRFDPPPSEPTDGSTPPIVITANQRWPVSAVSSALRRIRRRRRPRVR